MKVNPYKVFHSSLDSWRKKVHIVLVRPENPRNVGSIARALENMGIYGSFRLVAPHTELGPEAERLAMHAKERLNDIQSFPSLKDALLVEGSSLVLGSTAEVGSSHRPHPLWVEEAVERAVKKLCQKDIGNLFLVFGPESDGLTNEEISLCDWIATIPSVNAYRSLNLSQAVLVFSYEVNRVLLKGQVSEVITGDSQKERLVGHLIRLAEETGFILKGDPFKMRPKLESVFSKLPNHIPEASTLHGLVEQIIRSVRKGEVDLKGRFKHYESGR
jgi:TrmH family RNA methyltransferase